VALGGGTRTVAAAAALLYQGSRKQVGRSCGIRFDAEKMYSECNALTNRNSGILLNHFHEGEADFREGASMG
jgi:hypothetical protein